MNRELLHLYTDLSSTVKTQTLQHFKRSPRVLHYLQLLEEGIENTPKLVAQIYATEVHKTSITALTNRFYKLRSRVHVWLLQQMQYNETTQVPEQQQLTFFRLLVNKNEHIYVLPRLQALLAQCWTLQMFELLPEVIELTLRAGYAANTFTLEQRMELAEQMKEAQQLLHLLQQIKQTFYHLWLDVEGYASKVAMLRRLIKPYKETYPRLELLYHYIAFCMGVHREDLVHRTSGAMVRHLNAFNKLRKQHPDLPIRLIEPFYQQESLAFFYSKEAVFWYSKDKLRKCVLALKKRRTLLDQTPAFVSVTSAPDLHNSICFCIYAKEYATALQYIEELATYQDINRGDPSEFPCAIYEMIIYSANYAQQRHPQPERLLEQVRTFLEEKAPSPSFWIRITLIEFALLYGADQLALEASQHPDYNTQVQYKNSLPKYIYDLAQVVYQRDLPALHQLMLSLEKALAQQTDIKALFHYKTTLQTARHCARRLDRL